MTYVYQLREGVTWWDGSPLTADDVVFSMSQHLDPDVGSQVATFFGSVDAIDVAGSSEVTIKLKTPDPWVQYIPAAHAGFVVQKEFSQAHEEDIGTPGVLTMGTGPYRITEYVPDEGVTLERNEEYWGEKPAAETVSVRFIGEEATYLLAMRSEEIDGAFSVPVGQLDQWERIDGATIMTAQELSVSFFSFDVEADPWSDIHVRRAFAHALDRQGIVDAVLRGNGEPATSLVPPGQWGNLLTAEEVEQLYASLVEYPFDLDKARAELAQSSAADGFSATVQFPNSSPDLGRIALTLSENLRELGITLNVKEVTSEKWLNDVYEHQDLGIQIMSFVPDLPDPSNYPPVLLGSQHAVKNDFNLANYKNPEVDQLLDEQQKSTDPAERARALGEVLRIAADDLPYLPVYWPDVALAISDKFVYEGFTALYFNQPWAKNVKAAA